MLGVFLWTKFIIDRPYESWGSLLYRSKDANRMLPTYLYGLSILNSNRSNTMSRCYDDFHPKMPIEYDVGELNQILKEYNL